MQLNASLVGNNQSQNSVMKNMLMLFALVAGCACGGTKKDAGAVIKKVVCGDSVEKIMYDQNGSEYRLKVPGKCDTIVEKAAK
ncbi:MAG: hypothetical protein PSX36_14650 [bacterium]|nr:hypothetical protein [bacterium]